MIRAGRISYIHARDIVNSLWVSCVSLLPTAYTRPFNDCFSLYFCGLGGLNPLYLSSENHDQES